MIPVSMRTDEPRGLSYALGIPTSSSPSRVLSNVGHIYHYIPAYISAWDRVNQSSTPGIN